MYDQNAIKRIKGFTILSFSYKWLYGKVQVESCRNQSEKSLLLKLHKLLCECEIAVAHNGDSFDFKKINARFIVHRLPPPSPYRTIDTKKEAKRIAAFDSNSLNNLGIDLCEGEKIKHRGFDMWEGCLSGKRADWLDMERYNKQDVELLERIYLRLRPWMSHHPHLRTPGLSCPKCGGQHSQRRGFYHSQSGSYARFQCLTCHGWFRDKNIVDKLYSISV